MSLAPIVPTCQEITCKIFRAAPVNTDIDICKIAFKIFTRTAWLDYPAFFRINLCGHVCVSFATTLRSIHDGSEHYTEVPVVELEPEEYQSSVAKSPFNDVRNKIRVLHHSNQEIKVVVLGDHNRFWKI